MIHDFEYYIQNNMVKRSVISKPLAKSLLEKAELRVKRLSREEIREEMSSIMFEEAYEAMREASQALMQMKGFKPYSHEAVIAFLIKENAFPEQTTKSLDRYRVLRNKSVYEAQKISPETLMEALKFVKAYVPEAKRNFLKLTSP